MTENDILKQIALLNPRIINGNEIETVNDFMGRSSSSSPVDSSSNAEHVIENDEDLLNLWSSTKIFFDPMDASKINEKTEIQNNGNNDGNVAKLSEKEKDRQKYIRLKQQQQSVYARRGRRPTKNINNTGRTSEDNNGQLLDKDEIITINNFQQYLLNEENKNNSGVITTTTSEELRKKLLEATTTATNTNTIQSLPTPPGLMTSLTSSPLNPSINANSINDASNTDKNEKKDKDLYTQLLDSINKNKTVSTNNHENEKGKETKISDKILNKTIDRSKEIADKKKRRSAATMRCRERKKNQLQKKEQYIKYLENQILFLNGSILHMSNEITWLRRSFLDQYGEQSLKNIYMKNGFKDVNFNNLLFNGNNGPSSMPTFRNTNLISSDLTLSPSSSQSQNQSSDKEMDIDQDPSIGQQGYSYHLQQQLQQQQQQLQQFQQQQQQKSSFSLISNTNPVAAATTATSNKTNSNQPSSLSSFNSNGISNSNFLSIFNTTDAAAPSVSQTAVQTLPDSTNQKELFNQLDMETLNKFANLSKEQKDVILKILEKQQQLTNQKVVSSSSSLINTTTTNTGHQANQNINTVNPSSTGTKDFMNITSNTNSFNQISNSQPSLLNIIPTTSSVTTTTTNQYNSLSTNLLNNFNNQTIQPITYQNTTIANASSISSIPTTGSSSLPQSSSATTNSSIFLQTSHSAGPSSLNITTTATELLSSLTSEETASTLNPTTTVETQSDDYINLENLIYYI